MLRASRCGVDVRIRGDLLRNQRVEGVVRRREETLVHSVARDDDAFFWELGKDLEEFALLIKRI